MDLRTMVADLKSLAVLEFDNAPPWLDRYPSPGMRCAGLAALRYRDPIDNNEDLVINCAQLHAVLLGAHG
jgi:hypothetical protein